MSKKQDEYFFNNFIECADYACKAAHLLEEVMDNFDPEALPGRAVTATTGAPCALAARRACRTCSLAPEYETTSRQCPASIWWTL